MSEAFPPLSSRTGVPFGISVPLDGNSEHFNLPLRTEPQARGSDEALVVSTTIGGTYESIPLRTRCGYNQGTHESNCDLRE